MTHSNLATSKSCLYLAVEGERFCREGDWNKGISLFLQALAIGTDDLSCLSVIYCQLGNAYFYQQDYTRALEYHRWNLALARRMGDGIGEAFATGNLGNTLQMMGKYDEAIMCFTHELIIARQLDDKRTEAGALYNLGNVYQSKGKQWLPDSGEFPADSVRAQRKAAEYYKMGLELVRILGDRPAEGRALGSLANVYYLLSNFTEAIECYKDRLKIAKEFGDLAAQRRAHSNIGNAFIFLADFNSAVEHYREALQLSVRLKDTSLEAQACFSLGNTYILLRDPGTAVVFLLRHLVIARGLLDRIGEGRAHWSLANAYTAMKRYDLALRCSKRHRRIARQVNVPTPVLSKSKKENMGDRMNDQRANLSVFPGLRSGPGLHILDNSNTNTTSLTNNRYFGSMNSVFKSTSSCASDGLPEPRFHSTSSNSGGVTGLLTDNSTIAAGSSTRGSNAGSSHGRRGQLVSSTGDLDDEFLEMIFRIQTCTRINDQRSNLPDPLTQSIQSHVNPPTYHCSTVSGHDSRGIGRSTCTTTSAVTTTIARNPHRALTLYTSSTGATSNNSANRCSAPAILNDDDDLFALIQRVQSTRLDEQRCHPPLQ
ncbi:G-protein-signaling modulator 1 [Schistosoma japonicum]|nr:G-protein-signaling modulator 1 [Schistosoma japonicum]